jgi:hypothetical protein
MSPSISYRSLKALFQKPGPGTRYLAQPLQPVGPGLQDVQGEGEPPPAAPAPFHWTALRILCVLSLLHAGQAGFSSEEKTSSSKTRLQDSHLYSKIGMAEEI